MIFDDIETIINITKIGRNHFSHIHKSGGAAE